MNIAKQTLFIFTVVALAGCSNDGTEAMNTLADDSRLIRFTATGGDAVTTRTASAYDGSAFNVMADLGTTAYMPDQVATKSGGEWKTSTRYYMPASGTLRFYAYAGGLSQDSPRAAGSAPTFSITDQLSGQTDLLTYVNDVAYDAPGTVPIQFSHAMSAVWFSIKSNSKPGTVGNITIPTVFNSGTYTIGGSGTGWSSLSSSTTYMVDYSGYNTASNSLFLIPQDLSGKTVTIQFTPTGGSLTTLTSTLPTLNLQPGYRYNLQLEISKDVKITNTISPWNTTAPEVNDAVLLPPPGALPGKFSVSATKKVYFSKGNLRYASGAWSFFDNQYDYYSTYSASAWDKFGWSTSATTYGMSTSNSNSTYSGEFVDWGATMGSDWYTLSKDEYLYLFGMEENNTDKSGHARYRKYFRAKVNNVSGIVVLPDDIIGISNIPAESNRGTASTFGSKTYTTETWFAMESAGCVFLPAAGYREGNTVSDGGSSCRYWSGTAYSTDFAYDAYFHSDNMNPAGNGGNRRIGRSVRLVHPVE